MSDNISLTPESRWKNLSENGKIPVDVSSHDLVEAKPVWYDEIKWLKAREAVLKYRLGLNFSSFTGLLMILQIPDGLEPLLVTGNSKDIPSLYRRYLGTILHVESWYDDDIFNPETKGYKSIRQVRGMHKRVQSIMNEKFKISGQDNKLRSWYSHYDVSMTQFAFIGLAILFPEKCGLIAASHEEVESINYFWRVIGYFMGVSDEFNLCQFDKYEDIVQFNRLILQHEYVEVFRREPCVLGLEMTKAICLALRYFLPLVTFNSLAHWWQGCFDFNGYQLQPLTMKEKAITLINKTFLGKLMKNEGVMRLMTKLHKANFERKLKNKDKVYKDLVKKYKNCDKHTFYSDKMNYFDKTDKSQVDKDNANANIKPASGCPFALDVTIPAVQVSA